MVRTSRRQASLTAAAKIKATEDEKREDEGDEGEGSDQQDEDVEFGEEEEEVSPKPKGKRGRKPKSSPGTGGGLTKEIKQEVEDDYEGEEEEEVAPKVSGRKRGRKPTKVKEEWDDDDGEFVADEDGAEEEDDEISESEDVSDEEYGKKRKKSRASKTSKSKKSPATKSKKATPKAKKGAKGSRKGKKSAEEENMEYDLGTGGLDLDDPVVKEREIVLTKIVNAYPREDGYSIPELMRACDRANWDFDQAKIEVEGDERIQAERQKFLDVQTSLANVATADVSNNNEEEGGAVESNGVEGNDGAAADTADTAEDNVAITENGVEQPDLADETGEEANAIAGGEDTATAVAETAAASDTVAETAVTHPADDFITPGAELAAAIQQEPPAEVADAFEAASCDTPAAPHMMEHDNIIAGAEDVHDMDQSAAS